LSKRNTLRHPRSIILDSTDELQIKKAMDGEADRAKDLEFILSQPRGRRWVYDLLHDWCHVGRLSHVPNDTHSTAFNEGARSVGERLLEELRSKHHALWITMLEENNVTTE